ncbi:MAG TPA: CpsD/CapB family tyrosine-protein kinase [Erysipelotrichaceae bacterium]|nr:CpsD/CapB family tyrosine-protein kinase [Erysipelotrichaceae bacterium]
MNLFKRFRFNKNMKSVIKNPNYRIITVEQPLSLAAESYRRIKTSLEFANVDKRPQVIQVCSSIQGEGKTVTVLNLAATYAEDGKKVIVVDLDFRRPKLHRSFKIENKNGITDVLVGNVGLEEAIKHSDNGIDCLNRGSKVPYPTTILGSENIKEVFKVLRANYEYIIVDCPPILAVSDATIISKLCDGCIFVVSQSKTEKSVAKEAVKVLKDNTVNILGCVFSSITARGSNYYSNRYSYYYQNYYGKENDSHGVKNGKDQNGNAVEELEEGADED